MMGIEKSVSDEKEHDDDEVEVLRVEERFFKWVSNFHIFFVSLSSIALKRLFGLQEIIFLFLQLIHSKDNYKHRHLHEHKSNK